MVSPNMQYLRKLTICLRAMSSDFLEIILPNPVLSVDEAGLFGPLTAVSDTTSFWISGWQIMCPLPCDRPFGELSEILPRVTMGEDCHRFELTGAAALEFGFAWTVNDTPGRCLLVEIGLSGSFVPRFGGTSCGKSCGAGGCAETRACRAGELGRDLEAGFLLFVIGT